MAFLNVFNKKTSKPARKGVQEKKEGADERGSAAAPRGKAPRAEQKKSSGKEERLSHVIIRPRITEKASHQSGGNSYTFDIDERANKLTVRDALREVYGVTPVKVNIVRIKPKMRMLRGKRGMTRGGKKALVFLKEGDTIEFV